ncbi:MAG: hypothetical protein KC620_10960, partial [Myxococcales bacterium]|nr:hypothetical protein [Myxococcales bacterium]
MGPLVDVVCASPDHPRLDLLNSTAFDAPMSLGPPAVDPSPVGSVADSAVDRAGPSRPEPAPARARAASGPLGPLTEVAVPVFPGPRGSDEVAPKTDYMLKAVSEGLEQSPLTIPQPAVRSLHLFGDTMTGLPGLRPPAPSASSEGSIEPEDVSDSAADDALDTFPAPLTEPSLPAAPLPPPTPLFSDDSDSDLGRAPPPSAQDSPWGAPPEAWSVDTPVSPIDGFGAARGDEASSRPSGSTDVARAAPAGPGRPRPLPPRRAVELPVVELQAVGPPSEVHQPSAHAGVVIAPILFDGSPPLALTPPPEPTEPDEAFPSMDASAADDGHDGYADWASSPGPLARAAAADASVLGALEPDLEPPLEGEDWSLAPVVGGDDPIDESVVPEEDSVDAAFGGWASAETPLSEPVPAVPPVAAARPPRYPGLPGGSQEVYVSREDERLGSGPAATVAALEESDDFGAVSALADLVDSEGPFDFGDPDDLAEPHALDDPEGSAADSLGPDDIDFSELDGLEELGAIGEPFGDADEDPEGLDGLGPFEALDELGVDDDAPAMLDDLGDLEGFDNLDGLDDLEGVGAFIGLDDKVSGAPFAGREAL